MLFGKKMTLAAAVVLLAASCKKDEDSSSSSSGKTWTVNGTTYTADSITRDTANGANSISASTVSITTSGQPLGQAYFLFYPALPTTGGNIRVSNQGLYIVASTKAGTYRSADTTTVDASYTVSSGKIRITVPDVWLYNLYATTNRDSVKFSCSNLTEQ